MTSSMVNCGVICGGMAGHKSGSMFLSCELERARSGLTPGYIRPTVLFLCCRSSFALTTQYISAEPTTRRIALQSAPKSMTIEAVILCHNAWSPGIGYEDDIPSARVRGPWTRFPGEAFIAGFERRASGSRHITADRKRHICNTHGDYINLLALAIRLFRELR